MRGRIALLAALVLALVVAAIAYVVLYAPDATPGVRGLAPTGPSFTDHKSLIPAGPYRAAFSPNGAKLAVLSSTGISLAEGGKLIPVTTDSGPSGTASAVVAFTWLPTSDRLLVAEGPSPITRLNVIDLKGKVVADADLSQPLTLGEGFGLTVDSTNTRAVLVNVSRSPLGGARHLDLAVVDLTTGKVTLRETPEVEESNPQFITASSVLVTMENGTRRASIIDLDTGETKDVAPNIKGGSVAAGVLRDSESPVLQTLVAEPEVFAVRQGKLSSLGRLDSGQFLVALHPTGSAAVIRIEVDGESRLRMISLQLKGK